MRKYLLALLLALPGVAFGQYCPSCIQNSAAPQVAQINIGTATIRGMITASTGTFTYFYTNNLNAVAFSGNGVGITALNASNLGSGTVPSGVMSGAYGGITGIGALASGSWQGTPVGTQYGGTGQNFVNVSSGSIIYFSNLGTMSTLLGGQPTSLLQTNGLAAPSWTIAPNVSGMNIYGIPLTALSSGTLPSDIIVSSNSIPFVNGASVVGNISGAAGSYTGPIMLSQLDAGVLPNNVVASSITPTGVHPGTYPGVFGYSNYAVQYTVGADGRLTSSTQTLIMVMPSQIQAGTLPSNVTVPVTNINSGTLPSGIVVPAANISAGILNSGVIVSSLSANSATIAAGSNITITGFWPNITISASGGGGGTSPGNPGNSVQFNNGGAFTGSSNFTWLNSSRVLTVNGNGYFGGTTSLPSTLGVVSNANGAGYALQVSSQDTTTVLFGVTDMGNAVVYNNLGVGGSVTAATLVGDGAAVTDLSPGNLNAVVPTSLGGTGQNFSATAQGNMLYFSATGDITPLAPGTAGQFLQTAGAAANPFWGSPTATPPGGSASQYQYNNGITFAGDQNFNAYSSSAIYSGPLGLTNTYGFHAASATIAGLITVASTTINTVAYTWPQTQGISNTFLKNNGSGALTWAATGGGGGTPGGASTQYQYNNNGTFGGDANFNAFASSAAYSGTMGLSITYGVTAGSGTFTTTVSASSGTFTNQIKAATISVATTTFNGVTYTWPLTQGSASTVLTNNGSGALTFSSLNLANIAGIVPVSNGGTGNSSPIPNNNTGTGDIYFALAGGTTTLTDDLNFTSPGSPGSANHILTMSAGNGTGASNLAQITLIANDNGGGNAQINMEATPNSTNAGGPNVIQMSSKGGGGLYWVNQAINANEWRTAVNSIAGGNQWYVQNFNIGGNPFLIWADSADKGVGIYNGSPTSGDFEVGIPAIFDSSVTIQGGSNQFYRCVGGTNDGAVNWKSGGPCPAGTNTAIGLTTN